MKIERIVSYMQLYIELKDGEKAASQFGVKERSFVQAISNNRKILNKYYLKIYNEYLKIRKQKKSANVSKGMKNRWILKKFTLERFYNELKDENIKCITHLQIIERVTCKYDCDISSEKIEIYLKDKGINVL